MTQLQETSSVRPGLTRDQWRSGIAAWLGWLFDGLDLQLYTLIAAPFVAILLDRAPGDAAVKQKSAIIQGAFLVGWALGGGFFGRLGDLLGRSRALAMTILTYAVFTGLSGLSQNWWQLMVLRFVAALGIGGEWAVGSSLLAETWPRHWGPWIAAVLQTAVNIGVLMACIAAYLLAGHPRWIFSVGVFPALIVYWIRKAVPEPAEWHAAREMHRPPPVRVLFGQELRRITVSTIVVCSASLTGWFVFMFFLIHHVRTLPSVRALAPAMIERVGDSLFFQLIAWSVIGNFLAGAIAKWLGYRRAIFCMLMGMFACMMGGFAWPLDYAWLRVWACGVGFFSGVFGLFTMYLPPLFPVLLRTTGAGFCYNIGRIFAAIGTIAFGVFFSHFADFRIALFIDGFLFLPAGLVALGMPE